MKHLDLIFRVVLLTFLFTGLLILAWHVSWLHKQTGETRYEIQTASPNFVFVLDKQQRVIYAGRELLDNSKPVQWRTVALPKEP